MVVTVVFLDFCQIECKQQQQDGDDNLVDLFLYKSLTSGTLCMKHPLCKDLALGWPCSSVGRVSAPCMEAVSPLVQLLPVALCYVSSFSF